MSETNPKVLKTSLSDEAPLGWASCTLGELFDISAGGDWDPQNSSKVRSQDFCYPVVANALSRNGVHGWANFYTIPGDSLTITGRGDVGKAIFRPDPFVPIVRLLALVPKHEVSARFVTEYINYKVVFPLESTGVPQLTVPQVSRISVRVPPFDEQQRIATVLIDAENLISNLRRLIEKKQVIMQGMLQQLLTGKTRLPGFTSDWQITTLGESGVITGAGVDKKANPNESPVRLLNYMDVYKNEFLEDASIHQVVTANQVKIRNCDVRAGDVFFTPTSETPDDIARSAVALTDINDVAYSYHLVRWRPQKSWDPTFLGFAFNTDFFRKQVTSLASGSGTRYVISIPGFRSLKISLPPLTEQIEIGKTIKSLSDEINLLKHRLLKLGSLKQAMVQELLTGRTRLVPTGD